MITCQKCNKLTKLNESTGILSTIVYIRDKEKNIIGTRILKSIKTCMKCSGEVHGN